MATLRIFRDDDAAYTSWLTQHVSGWVINTTRNPSAAYLKLHRATCATIGELRPGYSRWTTGQYIKVCADERAELEAWAHRTLDADLQDGCHCVQYGTSA